LGGGVCVGGCLSLVGEAISPQVWCRCAGSCCLCVTRGSGVQCWVVVALLACGLGGELGLPAGLLLCEWRCALEPALFWPALACLGVLLPVGPAWCCLLCCAVCGAVLACVCLSGSWWTWGLWLLVSTLRLSSAQMHVHFCTPEGRWCVAGCTLHGLALWLAPLCVTSMSVSTSR
jgi:hypothetical protein